MIEIKVPATSANIGSGFDSLGLAVDLYNKVWMKESDVVSISSTDGTRIPTGTNNLVYKTAQHLFDECGKKLHGLKILQENNVPMTRGLGSSSACIVAGLVGANHLLGNPLSESELVDFAASLEGHPDNSTPALLGGLVTAAISDGHVYYVKQEIKNDIRLAAFIPEFELSTAKARGALPKTIDHKDGVFNLSRSALMSVSMSAGKYENLRIACQDKLHQPYRLSLIRDADKVFDAAYDMGAYAAYISGAGSTLMAFYDCHDECFEKKMTEAFAQRGIHGYKIKLLNVDNVGTTLSEVADI